MGFAVSTGGGVNQKDEHARSGGGPDLHDPRGPGESRSGVHAVAGRCSRARTCPSHSVDEFQLTPGGCDTADSDCITSLCKRLHFPTSPP